jgi:hypothetical protein
VGHMAEREPASTGRQGPEPKGMWQCTPFSLSLLEACMRGVLSVQGTNSGHRAHLERGSESSGGANSSTPRLVILNFSLGSYLCKALAAQGPKKCPAHSGPLGGSARCLGTTTT